MRHKHITVMISCLRGENKSAIVYKPINSDKARSVTAPWRLAARIPHVGANMNYINVGQKSCQSSSIFLAFGNGKQEGSRSFFHDHKITSNKLPRGASAELFGRKLEFGRKAVILELPAPIMSAAGFFGKTHY